MAEFAVIAAVVGGGLKATGDFMAGREASRAASFEAQQKERESQEYKIAGAEAEAKRREDFTSSLETIAALRAGRGVGGASPTALAGYDEAIGREHREVLTERYNYLSRAEQSRLAASMARQKAKTSLIAGAITAGADIAGSIYNIGTARRGTG